MANPTSESGRNRLRRLYRDRDSGEPTKTLSENVRWVILESIAGGGRHEADLMQLFPEGSFPAPCIGLSATAFGVNTVLGNEIAGMADATPEEHIKAIGERWDSMTDGEWSEGRRGPRLKHVLAAYAADAIERGRTVTEDTLAKVKAKVLAGEYTTKDLLSDTGINAQYQRIKAEEQQQKYQAALRAVRESGVQEQSKFDVD